MSASRTVRLIPVGDSQGIQIPADILHQLGLATDQDIDLEITDDHLVLRPRHRPRHDWDEQFRAMAKHGDDQLLDPVAPSLTRWDHEEWEW